jgi:heme oxygenase
MKTLTDWLKSETAALHKRVEGHPFIQSALDGNLQLESYRGYLRALAIIHATLEQLLDSTSDPVVRAVWKTDMARLPILESDLSSLPNREEGEAPRAVESALKTADDIRLRAGEDPVSMLGYQYVLEGSARGAPVFLHYLEKSLGLRCGTACAYFVTEGPDWDLRWAEFKQRINSAAKTVDVRGSIRSGAVAAFDAFCDLFDACHGDARHEAGVRRVTDINPEAGRHAIPANPAEVDAAVRAGQRCWDRFPYLALRYGDRGARFTASDGAWVASLVGEAQAEADQQLDWLAGLLAARGLPRLLMEDHLALLYEELSKTRPDKEPDYRKLKETSERLRRERFAQIGEAQWNELKAWFDGRAAETESSNAAPTHRSDASRATASAPPEAKMLEPQLTHMTDLILCAVADQRAGLPDGPQSFLTWLFGDAALAPDFLAAVEELITRAENQSEKS